MKKAIYLKINREDDFAIKNFSRWMDVSFFLNLDTYVICDKECVIERIKKEIILSAHCRFLKSDKSDGAEKIISTIATKRWVNAGYAHLTTFIHASENKYDYFWNIDADDTQICLSPRRSAELLRKVEQYAECQELDVFSLDMWPSIKKQLHIPQWSFGISYTKVFDWLKLISHHATDQEYKIINIDMFFTYLRNRAIIKAESFYVENLKFIHYSNDIHVRPVNSYLYYWKDGKLMNPYFSYFLNIPELGEIDIAEEVVRLDIGINDDEVKEAQLHSIYENVNYKPYMPYKYCIDKELFAAKAKIYFERRNIKTDRIVCFGAGRCMETRIEWIKLFANVKYVCDNNSSLWGQRINGLECISPDSLSEVSDFVIITIYTERVACEIQQQINELGIKNITYDEMLRLFDY